MGSDKGFLVLENGMVFPGKLFGAPPPGTDDLQHSQKLAASAGEVVFNTGMTGYHEILTDPSYTGQIVVMTYPHIGNYGCDPAWSESGTARSGTERASTTDGNGTDGSLGIKAAGLVVRSLYSGTVPTGRITLDRYLRESGIPGISDIDTRRLTLCIRDSGSPRGMIVKSEDTGLILPEEEKAGCLSFLQDFPVMEGRNLVQQVGTEGVLTINESGKGPSLALIDCGIKSNIIRECVKLDCNIAVYPSDFSAGRILTGGYQAVLISNGPGDPAVLTGLIKEIRALLGAVPVFGICLGHQLISLALGGSTFKMKFGHHGVNHPVRDELTKKVYITSQNHGFSVVEGSLPDDAGIWFTNANDGTIEGLYHRSLPVKSVQFHPESAPGPNDTAWIFNEFMNSIPGR